MGVGGECRGEEGRGRASFLTSGSVCFNQHGPGSRRIGAGFNLAFGEQKPD